MKQFEGHGREAPTPAFVVLCGLCVLCVLVLYVGLYVGDPSIEADTPFGFDDVLDQAKKLAGQPFKPPPAIPDFLTQISYDLYRDIRFDPALALWKDAGGNFQVEFIHPGLYYGHAVAINTYDRSGVRRVPFSPTLFTYGRNTFADKIPTDLGFAGFRVAYPLYKRSDYNHVLVFAGASYFRAVAKNQVFGLSARGLALDTGLPSGEEFPSFREFWLERASRDATRSLRIRPPSGRPDTGRREGNAVRAEEGHRARHRPPHEHVLLRRGASTAGGRLASGGARL